MNRTLKYKKLGRISTIKGIKMPASSNFNQAIRDAQTSSIVGPNVVQKALPYVGGGMVLTCLLYTSDAADE